MAIDEDFSENVRERWSEWKGQGTEVVAPPLLPYEVTSVLRNKIHRGLVHPDDAADALTALLGLPISIVSAADIHERAWRLSAEFGRPNAYDSYYLAVAEIMDCPLWTADQRLANAASGFAPALRFVGQP